MLINQVSFNDSHPIGNYFYVYLYNKRKIDKMYKILSKYKTVTIMLTTIILENVVEGLILPRKYIEENV